MSKLSLRDKILSSSLEFAIDYEKRAAAMEVIFLIHVLAIIVIELVTSWSVIVSILIGVNALVIGYQRLQLEKLINQEV